MATATTWPSEALYSGRAPTQVWEDLTDAELSAAQAIAPTAQSVTVAMISDEEVIAAGVLIADDLVLTNHHIAWEEHADAPRDYSVGLFDGTIIEVELIGDTGSTGMLGATDIALYRLTQPVTVTPLPVASESLMSEDDTIITVGHPQLLTGYGLFTVMGGQYKRILSDAMMMLIHTSPSVNTSGQVVGVNNGCERSRPLLMHPMVFLAGPAPVEVHDQILAWQDCQYQTAAPGSTIISYLQQWGVADEVILIDEPVMPSDYDLYTVVLHEVDHALGFTQALNALTGDTGMSFSDLVKTWVGRHGTHLVESSYPGDLINHDLAQGSRFLPSDLDVQVLRALYDDTHWIHLSSEAESMAVDQLFAQFGT